MIAASLDPINSLIRSYLRKAFLKEKRYGLAGTRFDLAKKPDPTDLTLWLYDETDPESTNGSVARYSKID